MSLEFISSKTQPKWQGLFLKQQKNANRVMNCEITTPDDSLEKDLDFRERGANDIIRGAV